MNRTIISLLFCSFVSWASAQPQGYYRYPALHGDTLIFTAEGDLWTVGIEGGTARRLTTHHGEESHPRVSRDGTTLAFTAEYEGPTELYTMPLQGGLPTRRTWEESASFAVGFSPQGKLLYATREYATLPDYQLVSIDLSTGGRQRIPLTPAGDGTYGDDGTLFFVRPDDHQNDTKRYKGGTARKIWRFASGGSEAVNLTPDYEGESHSPRWWRGRLYFMTDRDGTMNLWSMNRDGQDLRQHTRHQGWDAKTPSPASQGRIAYQVGADLWIYDINGDESRRVEIGLASDFEQLRDKWVYEPMDYLSSVDLHPEGESLLLTTRGRIFVAPAKQGRLVRATGTPGVRYRDAVFMPDGETVLTLSDESGEFEFHALPANGVGDDRALTDNGQILRYEGHPSPDGKWVVFSDEAEDLWLLEVETGQQRRLSTNREGGLGDMEWSSDSRWLVFTQSALNTFQQLHLYNLEAQSLTTLTSDRTNSFNPVFSRDGKFLYFLSDRNLVSLVGAPWGTRQPDPYLDKTVKLYEIALREGLRSPFRPLDELMAEAMGEEKSKRKPAEASAEGEPSEAGAEEEDESGSAVQIELDGLQARLYEVPAPPGNYFGLAASKQALFYLSRESGPRPDTHLMAFPFGPDPEPVTVAEDVNGFQLSQDGKKMMVRKGRSYSIVEARPRKADLSDARVDLGDWKFAIDVKEDFRQIFIDAWRMERDYFYDPGMHGLDWDAMRDKYMPLVERVTTRRELSDAIGYLVSELSALHVSVRGGDLRQGQDQIRLAKLGARLDRDEAAGGYRIDYIYQSDPDYPEERSPLADPALKLEAGDLIEAVNGEEVLSVPSIYHLLRDQAGQQVLLRIRDAGASQSRQVIVTPMRNEADLRYHDWEYTRRLAADEKGEGKIGYVHLRAMGGGNLTEWYRNFYPVFNRQGLIIDVRHNRGGNIDAFLLAKLMRKAWMYWAPRTGEPYWNLNYAFRGHMVVLVDERTASDGEAFAEGFRRLGLGEVIGVRTWGGEIWLSSTNRLTDRGLARAPMFGVYGPEREWLIEGRGVEPDMEVQNLPHATYNGSDAQLEAAVKHLLQKIAEDPRPVPEPPPYPDKSGN
ncbi:MAG TPA: S41 family peptidase [Acidobacteriota bacterium]|nr:S41 family peptidase [Acidobacteriota bacterium]